MFHSLEPLREREETTGSVFFSLLQKLMILLNIWPFWEFGRGPESPFILPTKVPLINQNVCQSKASLLIHHMFFLFNWKVVFFLLNQREIIAIKFMQRRILYNDGLIISVWKKSVIWDLNIEKDFSFFIKDCWVFRAS